MPCIHARVEVAVVSSTTAPRSTTCFFLLVTVLKRVVCFCILFREWGGRRRARGITGGGGIDMFLPSLDL